MINTRKVTGRRALRYETLEAAIRDAESLVDADRNGKLQALGNWTLGQALGHLAYWANAPFDGYPEMPRMPLLLRVILPAFRKMILNRGMPAGAKIRGVPGGTLGIDKYSDDEGLAKLRQAFTRLKADCPTIANPVFGAMTHEDWIKMNLRHAELHLSFFRVA